MSQISPRERYILSLVISELCADLGRLIPDAKTRLSFQIDCAQELNKATIVDLT